MSEELLIRYASPTLAGLKTGSLFNCPAEEEKSLNESIRAFNKTLLPKGLRLLKLYGKGGAQLYLYRPARLRRDMQNTLSKELLQKKHYPVENPTLCVAELSRRMKNCLSQEKNENFPHEIGLFLGYPPEDVLGFMRKGAGGSKRGGAWKVYGDEKSAQKCFARYKKCKEVYAKCYKRHNNMERLIVAEAAHETKGEKAI